MGIEHPSTPTNVAANGAGEPAARSSLSSTGTDARFAVAKEWIDTSDLT
jgi:hypothetical protein